MGAKAYRNAQRGKRCVRVYDRDRDWKQRVGPERADAEAVAAEIERDLARGRERRLAGEIGFEPGKPLEAANAPFRRRSSSSAPTLPL